MAEVPFKVRGNDTSAYVGVDPIYQNYANDTEKPYPFTGEEGKRVAEMLGEGEGLVYTHVSGDAPAVVEEESPKEPASPKEASKK